MTSITTKPDSSQPAAEATVNFFDNWFDPIETGVRERVREFIHAMIEGELDMSLSRPRYARCEALDWPWRGRDWRYWAPPWPPVTVAAGKLRPGGDRGPARQAQHRRWQDDGVEEQGAAGLSAAHACR